MTTTGDLFTKAPYAPWQRTAGATLTAAWSNLASLTGTGFVNVMTAGSGGDVVTLAQFTPRATITATGAVVIVVPNAGSPYLAGTAQIAAVSVFGTSVPAPTGVSMMDGAKISTQTPLRLGEGDVVRVAIGAASTTGIDFFMMHQKTVS